MNKDFNVEDFDWSRYDDKYKGGNRLIRNPKIKGQTNKDICYSREPYAQEMFNLLSGTLVVNKDLERGDCVSVTNIINIRDGKMTIELLGGLNVDIDLAREKRFIQIFGYNTVDEFTSVLQDTEFVKKFVDQGLIAYVIESMPLKISLWQGYLKKIREEFMAEIGSPSQAYVAKVYKTSKGGFFVEVQGVEAFLPGSLAAPNKIIDFESYIGKEVIVMIEDYLQDMNSFIVSHKKYIEHVLPSKIRELDLNALYKGTVTGASKYGIFIEFNDIFTGLLHNSKMKEETMRRFKAREYKPGNDIEFYINEITKDNRIIMTEESPTEKRAKFEKFIEENKDKIITGNVAAIMNFGIIVNVGDLSGLVPNKEFKKRMIAMRNFIEGDTLQVKFAEFKDDKLVFDLYVEEKDKGA